MSAPENLAPFVWRGRALRTIGELSDAILSVRTPEEAREFMAAYRANSPHADVNVGYMSGYYDRETMARVQEWFEVGHPVFGRTVPTPEEAFAAGEAAAKAGTS